MLKTLNEKLLLLSADKDRQALLFDESMRGQRKENMQLKKRIRELEQSCTSFAEVEKNLLKIILKLKKELNLYNKL